MAAALPVGVVSTSKPTPLILDDAGRVVDSSGRAVNFHKTLQPTIKVRTCIICAVHYMTVQWNVR